ncbi:MAG: AraC family transcriptional regulator [Polaromonas sp.]|uniref:AraC family transcriptional regulator n=1 Tax=Polaromonas sp. TaxID=1869339 RepID=UPI0025DCE0C2|nr:AraC family transcriptional regulator [Polaromonas sp.]MBI2727565.1 AraC family transcriptional regulator [Polaromonas sp.]
MPAPDTKNQTSAPAAATPMAFARSIVAAYKRYGQNPAEALKVAQITPAQLAKPTGHITARQMEVLSGTAMQALGDEALGAFSRKLPWGSYGMLARASITSPNLGMAVKRWCRHHALLADDIVLRVSTSGDSAAIMVEEKVPGQVGEFGLVHVLRNIHGLACWYVDSRIPLQGARFPFDAPLHADAYPLLFQGPLQFNAPQAEIRFDARYLALPLRRDEKALQQMLQRALPLTVLQYRRDRLLVQQVRQALANPAVASHNAETLAAALNMSPRSLHRQLQEEGASLQQLKDEVRFERAKDLLLRTSKPIKQVAATSGFRNEKSFTRAFHQWSGETPVGFRKRSA